MLKGHRRSRDRVEMIVAHNNKKYMIEMKSIYIYIFMIIKLKFTKICRIELT